MKHLNIQCVVLNIYHLVGTYSSKTENFGEVFYELANGPFGVYILNLQIYLRIFFNLLKPITEVVIENCLRNKSPSNNAGKSILNYLNVIMSSCPFEHVFFTYRAGIDYNKKSLQILNLK